jgi:hypothetical protein
MSGKIPENRWGNRKKIVIFSIILILIIAIVIFFLSAKPSGKIMYVTTDGSGDFNCDGPTIK